MPVDVGTTLRQALAKLTAEKQWIDRQIGAIETALEAGEGPIPQYRARRPAHGRS